VGDVFKQRDRSEQMVLSITHRRRAQAKSSLRAVDCERKTETAPSPATGCCERIASAQLARWSITRDFADVLAAVFRFRAKDLSAARLSFVTRSNRRQ